jgi:hypothetical protein
LKERVAVLISADTLLRMAASTADESSTATPRYLLSMTEPGAVGIGTA